jgi:predicted GNAT family N-acyltransferase
MESIIIKEYPSMPKEAWAIRDQVFVKEQGFEEEFDEIDGWATHLVLFIESEPIATCRYFFSESKGGYLLGRIAVIKKYRGKKIGAYMLKEAAARLKALGAKEIYLHAQTQARGFYEKQGYVSLEEYDDEEGVPHVWMKRQLL